MVSYRVTVAYQHTKITVDVAATLQAVTQRLEHHLSMQVGHALVHVDGKLSLHTRLQSIFNDRLSSCAERALHHVFMVHAVSAEKMGPGGFDACLARSLETLKGMHRDHQKKSLVGRRATHVDIQKIVNDACQGVPTFVTAALDDALSKAGMGGRIVVEKALNMASSVELVRGYTFMLSAAMPFVGTLSTPRAALIDGYIESVSEIDRFLNDAHEARDDVLLFCRGMAADVLNTLRVNYERGMLRIVPVLVPMEVESLNTLADLSVVSGADVVSSLKGDMISSLRLASCPRIEQAAVHAGRLMLVSTATRASVCSHVEDIRRRRLLQSEELGSLLDARIRSLSPAHVILRLPVDRNFTQSAQAIDRALRGISACVSHGLIDDHGLSMLASPAPMSTVAGVLMHSRLCAKELAAVGAVITS